MRPKSQVARQSRILYNALISAFERIISWGRTISLLAECVCVCRYLCKYQKSSRTPPASNTNQSSGRVESKIAHNCDGDKFSFGSICENDTKWNRLDAAQVSMAVDSCIRMKTFASFNHNRIFSEDGPQTPNTPAVSHHIYITMVTHDWFMKCVLWSVNYDRKG